MRHRSAFAEPKPFRPAARPRPSPGTVGPVFHASHSAAARRATTAGHSCTIDVPGRREDHLGIAICMHGSGVGRMSTVGRRRHAGFHVCEPSNTSGVDIAATCAKSLRDKTAAARRRRWSAAAGRRRQAGGEPDGDVPGCVVRQPPVGAPGPSCSNSPQSLPPPRRIQQLRQLQTESSRHMHNASQSSMLDEDDRSVQLPIELIDAIFDELGQMDKRALYSCALVCHAWRPLAQTHIFREVSLTIGYHGKAANSDATPQCRTAFRRIRGFFEARPAIAASVRELKLRTIPVVTLKRWDWLLPPATAYHDARSLLYLLRLLPHLEHLDLQDVFVTSAPAAEDEHALASVKTLVISSRQEEIPPSDALLLLNCFKRVEDLEVDVACFYNFCRASVECPPPHRLAIDSVSTQGSMSEALFVHLAQSPSSHVLHTLVLRDLELCPLVGLQRLLAATQANLTRLSLSFSSFCGDPQAETSAVVSLACCSALKSLEISIQASPFDWQAVWQIIATVSAGSNVALEDLTLVLREREQIVVEGMWVFSDRDILSSVHSTLSRLNAHGAFKRFLLKQVASGGWLGEKEVFPDILQSHAGVSR